MLWNCHEIYQDPHGFVELDLTKLRIAVQLDFRPDLAAHGSQGSGGVQSHPVCSGGRHERRRAGTKRAAARLRNNLREWVCSDASKSAVSSQRP